MKAKKSIHAPYNKLKGFAVEKGITYANIARAIAVSPATVSQKINGSSDFYLNEKRILKQAFNMPDEIFYP